MKAFFLLAGIFGYMMLWAVVIPILFSAQNTVYVILSILLGIASFLFAFGYLVRALHYVAKWMEDGI